MRLADTIGIYVAAIFVGMTVPATGWTATAEALQPVSDHLITGSTFRLDLASSVDIAKVTVTRLELASTCGAAADAVRVPLDDRVFERDGASTQLVVQVPHRKALESALGASLRRACLELEYDVDLNSQTSAFRVQLPSKIEAYLIAFGLLLASFVLISRLKMNPLKPHDHFAGDETGARFEDQNHPIARVLKQPMAFCITPMGSYSISLFQALFWTYLTIFVSVYVYWLSGSFLDLTDQILLMLGIGGGTAVGSKVNAISRAHTLPPKFLGLVTKTRVPRLGDLIASNGRPNLFKFQIFAFTLIAGAFALIETLQSFAIPVIPDSLVTLMGLSSVVYLGNEVTADNAWKRIQALQEEIETDAAANGVELHSAQDVEQHGKPGLVAELKAALQAIYCD